jgi:hypothetical protein
MRPCFRPRSHSWGFAPTELLPPNEAVAPLGTRDPLAVSGRGTHSIHSPTMTAAFAHVAARASARLHCPSIRPPDFEVWHLVRSPSTAASTPGGEWPRVRCSHGVHASSGFCAIQTWEGCLQPSSFHGLSMLQPSHGRRIEPWVGPHSGPPKSHSIQTRLRRLSLRTDPLEVFNLILVLASSEPSAVLAYGFASGPEPRRRAPRTLFGLPRAPTGASREGSWLPFHSLATVVANSRQVTVIMTGKLDRSPEFPPAIHRSG